MSNVSNVMGTGRLLDESYTFVSIALDCESLSVLLKRASDASLYPSEYIKFVLAEHETRERIKESLERGNEE